MYKLSTAANAASFILFFLVMTNLLMNVLFMNESDWMDLLSVIRSALF